jgi:Protein of unknown function (DUF2950)
MVRSYLWIPVVLISAAFAGYARLAVPAQTLDVQQSFATPDEALTTLIAAVRRDDMPALRSVLGPGTEDLLSSGDPVADRKEREAFLQRYQARHELVAGDANHLVLLVGADRWPSPIPLVRKDGRWRFDGDAGADEVVLRRIGANELHTIAVMRGFVAAENDYASRGHDGFEPGVFARKLNSDPGKHDGLYWETKAGEPLSPGGPLLASASAEGYGNLKGGQTPYHGYLFRLLSSQGTNADGGQRDYLVNGKLTGGFALLAYPADYGASGIMTFMVNQDGVVWQRDLGEDTARTAAAIQSFDPDDKWTPVTPEE